MAPRPPIEVTSIRRDSSYGIDSQQLPAANEASSRNPCSCDPSGLSAGSFPISGSRFHVAKNEGRSCNDYVELTRSYLASAGRTRFSSQQKYSRISQAFRLRLTRDVQKSTIQHLKGKLGVPSSCLLDLLLVCFAIRPAFCSLSISQATEPLSRLMKLCIV